MSRCWAGIELIVMVAVMAAISLAPIANRVDKVPALSAAPSPSEGTRRGNLTPDTIVYTKEQADQVFFRKGEADLSGYATEQWVEDKGYLTSHQSLEGYFTKEDIVRLVSATIRSVACAVYLTKEADGTVSVKERSAADIESLVEEVLSYVMTESNTGVNSNTQGVATSVSGENHGSR